MALGVLRDKGVVMRRADLEGLPAPRWPLGCGMRPMSLEEAPLWAEIQAEAEPFLTIDERLFHSEFGDAPEPIRERCFFIHDDRMREVGTISAWLTPEAPEQGRIHWVAVRPSAQGRGLARAALAEALWLMRRWHRSAWLATSTGRVAAIKLYLEAGFLPDVPSQHDRDAWLDLRDRYPHPLLVKAL